jgi:dethiobiotin synthetase
MNARSGGWFIAGTDTGVGKTRVTAGLLAALSQRGVRAAGMKPVAAGRTAAGNNEDVEALVARSCAGFAAQDLNPYCFAEPISPHLAAQLEGVPIDPTRIVAAHARLAARCEVVLVEGTGGWLTPIGATATMADIAQALELPVVLVVGLRLGCLNHALLSSQAIARQGLALAGWIGSLIDPAMRALDGNIATLTARLGAPMLGHLPHAPCDREDAWHLGAAAEALLQASRRAAGRETQPLSMMPGP